MIQFSLSTAKPALFSSFLFMRPINYILSAQGNPTKQWGGICAGIAGDTLVWTFLLAFVVTGMFFKEHRPVIRIFKVRAMKKWNAIGIFIVLVTVMVLMSGCISSASTGSAPVATPAPQIVNKTMHVTPALTPATAVPAGTAPVAPPATPIVYETVFVTPTTIPILFPATNDYQNDESAYTNLKPALSADGGSGSLIIRVEGCPADGLTVFIARNGTNVSPIDNTYLLDRMVAGDQNTVFLPVKILPDGSSEIVKLAPGTYTAYLPDKNGDEIEDLQSFKIGANFMSYVSLSGPSYSTPRSSGCSGCSCSRSG